MNLGYWGDMVEKCRGEKSICSGNKDDKGQIPKELVGKAVIEWTWDGIADVTNEKTSNIDKGGSHINNSGTAACRRCGRALSNPTSISSGFGPVCRAKK